MSLPNRRPHITQEIGPFAVTVGFKPGTTQPVEVFLTKRSKVGSELDDHLYELGVAVSKLMQGEDYK